MAGVGMEVLRFRGIDTMRLGGVRVMGGTAVSPLHFLGEARKKPACLVLEGPKGVTQGGAVQLLLSPEIRPLIRDLFDIVLMVLDEQKN
jgi:hypothetical protein